MNQEPMLTNSLDSAEPALTELAMQSLAHARAGDQVRAYELAARCAALLAIADIDRERAGMCFALCPILAHAGDFASIEALRNAALRFFHAGDNASLPEVPRVLNRFGELLRREHRYAEAEPLLRKALEAARVRTPEDADTISNISNNLGLVYLATANFDAAQRVLFEALEAALTASGPQSPDVAIVADNLGSLFAARGNRSKSRRFTEQAVEIFQQAGPPDDDDLLTARIRLAGLDSDDGKLEVAEASLRQVIAAISLPSPNGQDLLASASISLGITLRRANRLDDAAAVLLELIQILRGAGRDSSAFAINAKDELARILIALGFHGEALSLLSAVAAASLAELVRFSMGAAEVRQLDYKQLLSSRLDRLLSLVATHLAHDPGARELAFLHLANRKGIVNHRLRIRGQATRDVTGNLASALQAARSARETALLRGPGLGDESLYRNELIAATERVAELEVRVANEIGTMHAVPGIASAAEVCGWLAPNTALVEVIEFRSYAPAADSTGDAAPGPKRYLAFVLSAGDPDVKLVDLGNSCVIDAEIDRYLSQLAGGRDAERDVGEESRTAGATSSVSTTLWRDVFGPISAVTSCRSLVLSLDGQLAEYRSRSSLATTGPGGYSMTT